MGVAWAWPSYVLSDEQKLQAVLGLLQKSVAWLQQEQLSGHPLEICHLFAGQRGSLALA